MTRAGARIARTLPLIAALAPACTRSGEVLRPMGPVVLQVSDVRLSAGTGHACHVAGGALSCWGNDADGRLGVPAGGTGTGQAPVIVTGGPWIAPAAGESHSCALAADGSVACWGANAVGQLGAGDLTPSDAPRVVQLPARAVDVRTAFDHTCALLVDASLWCWGYNWEGQLGLGDVHPGVDHPEPIQVGTDRDWVFVSTGQGHSCGIRSPGTLYCWGRNTDGQIGQGAVTPQQHRSPTQVGADADWVEVSAGQATTCARKRDGSGWCWGSMSSGTLAVGDLDPRYTPAPIPTFDDWLQISNATFQTCGVRAGGEIWCAGRNTEGQIGGTDLVDAIPSMQRADPTAGWVEVRAGRFFTCARKADDSVWCIGRNDTRQLNTDPATLDRSATMVRIR
jgi:alpha-tubulin suppressor-like RCC1 family protein